MEQHSDIAAGRYGDGRITRIGDFVVLIRLVTGVIQPTALESMLGDINSDGQLGVSDILLLQQAILSDTDP